MRHTISNPVALLIPLLLLAGCDRAGGTGDTVARAGDFQLSVEETARMIAPLDEIPADPSLLEAVGEFWVDYTLLTWAVNQPGELDRIDFAPLLRQQRNQEMVMRLRDQVIEVDTVVTDDEVLRFFEEVRPGEAVHVRHILLLFPGDATPAQRDSVWRQIEEIRDRARAGGSQTFAELARTYSQDEGSAERGGDLSWLGRGTVVPEFEEVAFALEPGQVSDVVETQYGLHVIRVEDREQPPLEEIQDILRAEIQMERGAQAESIYVTGIEEQAGLTIHPDAMDIVRELARRPYARLANRAARRPLVTWEGGAYTAGDFLDFLRFQQPGMRAQISEADAQPLEGMLKDLSRIELLVAEARRQGVEVSTEEEAEVARELREQLRSAAETLGMSNLQPRSGESLRDAVDRESMALMNRLVRGEQELVPLGNLTLPLRIHYRAQVSQTGVRSAADRVLELRAEGYLGEPSQPAPAPAPEFIPDTTPAGGNDDG